MIVYALDPVRDPRWSTLVDHHPLASVFHTTAWLGALQRTYGYRPLAFTTSLPGSPLEEGLLLCEVHSWLTGRRLVSLPFSDHCEPLITNGRALAAIADHLEHIRRDGAWDYVELRPHTERWLWAERGALPSERFWLHCLDLRPSESSLFAALHKDSVQRKIHRAEKEGLEYEEGIGERLVRVFYELLVETRHRHQLPPQPLAWFRNLAAGFGSAMKVRVAFHGRRAIAAILTLQHRDTMVYKYGASDARFHALGGMHLLFWKTIQDARSAGRTMLDFGRCDRDNTGLATFKERWGATRSDLTYWRYGARQRTRGALRTYALNGAKQVLDHAPAACRIAAGRFLYRHAG